MADEPNPNIDNDEDELFLDEPLEPDEDEQREPETPEVNDEQETVLTFGDDAEEQEGDSGLVKHLRGLVRDKEKQLAEARRSAPREEQIEVGEKPTIAGCDYDEEKYEAELDAWKDRQAKKAKLTGQSAEAEEREREAWQAELDRVNREKDELRAPDVEEAFDIVRGTLSTAQQAALVQATEKGNSGRMIYALAKHPSRLAEIASIQITDAVSVIRFTKAVSKLEGQLKMTTRRKAPDPEKIERGSGKVSTTSADKKLEKLEKEADRTGDRTALISYKKKIAAK